MTGTPLEVAGVMAVTGLVLAAVIHADNWWQSRRPSAWTEPPSRLDQLDGIDTPARSSVPPPPGVAVERAGADVDPWSV